MTRKELENLLMEQHAAEMLCVSVSALRKWRLRGGGPPYLKLGRAVRYRQSELLTWLETRSRAHRAGSFKVNLTNGRWSDFATGDRGGDLISLAAYLFDLEQGAAAKQIAAMLGLDAYE